METFARSHVKCVEPIFRYRRTPHFLRKNEPRSIETDFFNTDVFFRFYARDSGNRYCVCFCVCVCVCFWKTKSYRPLQRTPQILQCDSEGLCVQQSRRYSPVGTSVLLHSQRGHLPISGLPLVLDGHLWLLRLDLHVDLADRVAARRLRDLEDASESVERQRLCIHRDGTLVSHLGAHCNVLCLLTSAAQCDGLSADGDASVDCAFAAERRHSTGRARTAVRGGGEGSSSSGSVVEYRRDTDCANHVNGLTYQRRVLFTDERFTPIVLGREGGLTIAQLISFASGNREGAPFTK